MGPKYTATKNPHIFISRTFLIQVNKSYTHINVEQQVQDPDSILNYYKKLIQLRKQNEVITTAIINSFLKMIRKFMLI